MVGAVGAASVAGLSMVRGKTYCCSASLGLYTVITQRGMERTPVTDRGMFATSRLSTRSARHPISIANECFRGRVEELHANRGTTYRSGGAC